MFYLKLLLVVIYVFSPVDIIPDVVPVAGVIDDILFTITMYFFTEIKEYLLGITGNKKPKYGKYNAPEIEGELINE